MADHFELSPSSAHRWMRCPGSVSLSRGIPDRSSAAADEGTLAHQIAAEVLVEPKHGNRVAKHPAAGDLGAANWAPLQSYVDYVRDRSSNGEFRYVEVKVDLSGYLGEGGFGTADCVIYDPKTRRLIVIDLKFGQGNLVFANERGEGDTMLPNPQLAIYALGAREVFEFLDVDDIELVVHQPRREHVSVAAITPDRLDAFALSVSAARQRVESEPASVIPGEVQCKWCPARATCDARARWHLDAFEREVSLLSPGEIARLLGQLKDMRSWCDDLEQHALTQLMDKAGSVPGWKVVEGRSVRQWNDQAMLILSRLVGEDQMFERKLITITAAEKLLGKEERKLLEPATSKSTGKPTLVPEGDPRPALDRAGDFNVEAGEL